MPKQGRTTVELEAWVCRKCAYVELYARDLEVLEAVAAEHPDIEIIDLTDDEGPFR